ncbi:MAG: F0F1 ATP synthase subunit B [Anaerolineae bacterium]|nr:F0F1 ATP synthase subunit B [Anaerolineae bacterium]
MININWSTLLFQIINFAVMVFILFRFFFKPVVKALDDRAKRVTNALDEAARREREAEAMHSEYEQKLTEANELVIQMKQQAQEDLEKTKQQFIAQAQKEIEQMRNRAHDEIEDARRQAVHQHRLELGHLVTTLSARLIHEAGGEGFQKAALQEFFARLDTLSADTYRERFSSLDEEIIGIQLVTAGQVEPEMINLVKDKVAALIDRRIEVRHTVNPALVAGATLRFGDMMIDGSLEGQLDSLRAQYIRELEKSVE